MTTPARTPWWLWPNLLSLDAPLVAVAWLYMLAKAWGVGYHPTHEYISLALVVWGTYVADRLLDAGVHGQGERCSERHHFHHRFRWIFAAAATLAFIAAAVMILTLSPKSILYYGVVGAFMAAAYFAMALCAVPNGGDIPYAKNILGGITFAFGTALVGHVYMFDKSVIHLLLSREFILFAVLCVANICAIDLWEHASRTHDEELRAADELALTLPLVLLGAAAFMFSRQGYGTANPAFFSAVLTAAALLFVINRIRARFSMPALRVLADAALLLPFAVFLALK